MWFPNLKTQNNPRLGDILLKSVNQSISMMDVYEYEWGSAE